MTFKYRVQHITPDVRCPPYVIATVQPLFCNSCIVDNCWTGSGCTSATQRKQIEGVRPFSWQLNLRTLTAWKGSCGEEFAATKAAAKIVPPAHAVSSSASQKLSWMISPNT